MFLGEGLCGCLVAIITKVFICCVFVWEEQKMASQCSGNKNKSRRFVYNLNEKWENKYFLMLT